MQRRLSDEEYENLRGQLELACQGIPDKQVDSLQRRVVEMIQYAIERLDYYEAYRRFYLQIGLAAVGLAAALLGIVGQSYVRTLVDDPTRLREWTLWGPYTVLTVVTVAVAWTGARQVWLYAQYTSPEYPYREVAEPTWFFRYTLTKEDSSTLLKRNFGVSQEDTQAQARLERNFLQDSLRFLKREGKSSPRDRIRNDVDQVLALHTLTRYKFEHAKRMRDSLVMGVCLIVLSGATTIAVLIAAAIAAQ